MGTFSLLVLIVYVTIALYVVYMARENYVQDKAKKDKDLVLDKLVVKPLVDDLNQSLETQLSSLNLDNCIKVDLGNEKVMEVDKINQWGIKLENKTNTYAIFVDWKTSTLTNLDGQNQTLACVTPNEGSSQSPSLVPPLEKLDEKFTIFTPNNEALPFVKGEVVFKRLDEEKPCTISLRLFLRLQEVGRNTNSYTLVLTCPFRFRKPSLQEVRDSMKKQ